MTDQLDNAAARRPHTPQRSIRVREELWRRVQDKARSKGETASDVAVRAFERYVEER
jgi:macrodomain Ter protein organizer (MatP/YcbG family)